MYASKQVYTATDCNITRHHPHPYHHKLLLHPFFIPNLKVKTHLLTNPYHNRLNRKLVPDRLSSHKLSDLFLIPVLTSFCS